LYNEGFNPIINKQEEDPTKPKGLFTLKQPKSVQFWLSDQFCQAVRPIFVSIRLMDITLHKIRQRDRKIPISKLVGELGKIGWRAWQNQSDITKNGCTTVNGA
jgi:hypothetical protein